MSSNLTRQVTYKGKKYVVRDIYHSDYGDITLGTIALESVLVKDHRNSSEGVRRNAEELDNQIAYYLDTDEQLELPVGEIIEIMKVNGYEI